MKELRNRTTINARIYTGSSWSILVKKMSREFTIHANTQDAVKKRVIVHVAQIGHENNESMGLLGSWENNILKDMLRKEYPEEYGNIDLVYVMYDIVMHAPHPLTARVAYEAEY